jgi:hypothetical protein
MWRAHLNGADMQHVTVLGIYARDKRNGALRHLCEVSHGTLYGGAIADFYGFDRHLGSHSFDVEGHEQVVGMVALKSKPVSLRVNEPDYAAIADDRQWAANETRG